MAPQVAEREEQRLLGERIKEIFKKYGVTVVSVGIAIGAIIGAVFNKLASGIKSVTKKLDDGITKLGDQIKSILPGLLGAIVKFVFDTAGKVISFLGEHAWLLILAVAAFLIKKTIKRKR